MKPIAALGTTFQNPILLASGTAGFGRELTGVMDLDRLGGLVTKAVSPEPRPGHAPPRVTEFSAGMINAVGLANPGLEHVATVEVPWLERHLRRARVLVNVVGNVIQDFVTVVWRLGDFPIVAAFELNVSCPNTARGGEEFCADPTVLAELVARCRAETTKPLVVKLAPTLDDMVSAARAAARAGANGLTLVNTIPSTVYPFRPADVERARRLGYGKGGVSGPALLGEGLRAVRAVSAELKLPIIGAGGIRTIGEVEQYLAAGATLVAVGTAALAHPRLPERLAAGWERRVAHG